MLLIGDGMSAVMLPMQMVFPLQYYSGGDQAAADAYLLESDVALDASMANQRIGTQKWIAMFDQGIEALYLENV